jgi:hypothetical protein
LDRTFELTEGLALPMSKLMQGLEKDVYEKLEPVLLQRRCRRP